MGIVRYLLELIGDFGGRLSLLILYAWVLVRFAKRSTENPVQHDGKFISNNPRILRALKRMALPLSSVGIIAAALWSVPLAQTLSGEEATFLLQLVIGFVVFILVGFSSLLIMFVWFWRIGLKPSLLVRVVPLIIFIFVLIIGSILFLDLKPNEISAIRWFASKGAGALKAVAENLWVLPLLMTMLALPLFLVYILRNWTVELFPLWKANGEEQVWDQEARRLAVEYCIGFFTTRPKPTHFLENGEMIERVKGNPFLGSGPGLVVTEPENILAVRDSSGFKRFVGPGAAFLGVNSVDIPYAVVDLQKQFRLTRIHTLTRDGVEISVPCSSMFRIDAGDEKVAFGRPWPYRVRAAFLALHAASEVNPDRNSVLEENEIIPWEELPLRTATAKLEQVVAGYTLDELYGTKKSSPLTTLPRKEITREVRTYVRKKMAPVGIKVLGGGVGAALIPLDEKVTQQRVDTWKAQWADKLEVQEGKATGAYLREAERVRVRILNELFQLACRLEESGGENKKALLAARLLEMLDNIARGPGLERLLPEQVQSYYELERRRSADEQSGQEET